MYLSETFLEGYKDKIPNFGGNGLGAFVYLRTYSRWLNDKGRRETWHETVARVTNYSVGLATDSVSQEERVREAELLYDAIFNLRVFPAGRTLWIGGTEAAEKHGLANFKGFYRPISSTHGRCWCRLSYPTYRCSKATKS
jgi:ribonucleoside-triphosphate reductase (thioredoxin)